MITLSEEQLKRLDDPFPEKDIEWRIGRSGMANGKPWGKCLAYLTARAVHDRLDEVCGKGNWKVEQSFLNQGVLCTLSIKINGEWVAKQDGAEVTDIEPFKGGMSGAMKRAAAVWGIGRYLYSLEEGFVEFTSEKTGYSAKIDNQWFNWRPPALPAWALPKGEKIEKPRAPQGDGGNLKKPGAESLNERLGVAAARAPTLGVQARSSSKDWMFQSQRIEAAWGEFKLRYPTETLQKLLTERYNQSDLVYLDDHQIKDLADFVETMSVQKLPPGKVALAVRAPRTVAARVPLPAQLPEALGDYLIKVRGPHQGKTFDQLGKEGLEAYARDSVRWFKANNKRITKDWMEFFDYAAAYCFGTQDGSQWNEDPIPHKG